LRILKHLLKPTNDFHAVNVFQVEYLKELAQAIEAHFLAKCIVNFSSKDYRENMNTVVRTNCIHWGSDNVSCGR
jgi:hypothetical protein